MAERDGARGRRRDAAFTEAMVLDAALALLDEAGVEGLTMRSLARRLDTYPATLYWHVGKRQEVLAKVFQRVLAEMRAPDLTTGSWEEALKAMAREYRRVLHLHPNAAALVLYPIVTGAEVVEAILSCLSGAGFHGEGLADAFNMFVGSVTGWVAVELSPTVGEAELSWRDEMQTRVRGVVTDAHPTITREADHLVDQIVTLRWHGGRERPLDRSFEASLHGWIAGLGSLLDGQG